MRIFREWRLVLGLGLLLPTVWRAIKWLLDLLGMADLVISRSKNPDWMGAVINAIINWFVDPPGWMLFAWLIIGFILIRSDLQRGIQSSIGSALFSLKGLEIVFIDGDSRCVHDTAHPLYGGISRRSWNVGVRNSTKNKSIDDVSLRANDTRFTQCMIGVSHMDANAKMRFPVFFNVNTLCPGGEDFVKLFEWNAGDMSSGPHDILNKKQTIIIEARGRDTPPRLATLEYDPSTRPPIVRRVS